MSIVAEAPGFLQVFSDGTVKRLVHQTVPPSANISNKYNSEDVTIDSSKPITARIFLPVLVYFHGGGFCIGSTTWLGYHVFLGNPSSAARAIVVLVDYRLAPENKLPTAYEDCFAALEWLGSNSDRPWRQRADLSRVFLSGDSAGGNIAHHDRDKHPQRWDQRVNGDSPVLREHGTDRARAGADDVAMNDMFWKLSLPDESDGDFYGCNFDKGGAMTEWSLFPAVVVFVAGLDFLKERGVMYADFLKEKGVKSVRLVEAEGEQQVFHAWNPESEATCLLQNQISCFMESM